MTAQWIVKSFFSIYGILRAYRVVYAATRRSWPFRGLSPTAKFLPPLRGSVWNFLLTVGYHPRLYSSHHYVVLYGYLAIIMHYAL